MEKIEWPIKNQNAKFKFSENLSKETSINISKEIYEFLGARNSGDIVTVILRKKDFLLAFSKLVSNLPLHYYRNGSQKAEFGSEFFESSYNEIAEHFGENERIQYQVKLRINDESTTRYYLYRIDGMKNFILRDFLIGENSVLNFIKNDSGEIIIEPVIKVIKREESIVEKEEYQQQSTYTPNFSQIIYYGVPGSGKSHKIDEQTQNIPEEQKIRVVFHPEYTNADFIGQVLPKVEGGTVKYEFKPGPFTKILYRAYQNPGTPYYLIIEEINRGNAAAIFGDVFQLLDRIKKDDRSETVNENTFGEGWSKYFVENDFINNYLRSPVEYSKEGFTENHGKKSVTFESGITFTENTGIRLPPNLSLFATMNTSDQNVFTLDNAFQRRWEMELVQNQCDDSSQMNAKITVANQTVTWEDFQQQINNMIGEKSNEGGLSSMEDKRLGCWFIKVEDGVIDEKKFANKVLKYLWDDAFKFYHQEIFESDIKNFEELQKRFFEKGFDVFSENCGLKDFLSTTQPDSESKSETTTPQDSESQSENSEQ